MQERVIGKSGHRVSALGLGTMSWGNNVDEATADALLHDFVSHGGSLIDTAPIYGAGAAEKMIGRSIKNGIRRDGLTIMTKGGFSVRDGDAQVDTSRGALLDDLRGSLRRLKTDYIDVWQIHAWGNAPLEETLSAIDFAVSNGMVRYAGLSNFVGWQTASAVTWQNAMPGRTPLVSLQVEYSLLARNAEMEIIPAAQHFGLGVFPWSPLGRSVLTGEYRNRVPRTSRAANEYLNWFVEPYLTNYSRSIVEAVVCAAEGLDLTPAQVALLWVRDAPGVTAPLLGCRTKTQLSEILQVADKSLPEPIVQALDDVSGGANLHRQKQ